jgi:hypothetical protein
MDKNLIKVNKLVHSIKEHYKMAPSLILTKIDKVPSTSSLDKDKSLKDGIKALPA